jgi:AGCS family alanine or glycine:cation symporter
VAVAVTVGGPGATFWLIVAGFLGMSTKFVECTLGVKYRKEFEDGHVSGGPMYYLRQGFSDRGMEGFGKFIGTFYAIGIFIGALGIGNMFQSNQAYVQLNNVSGALHGCFLLPVRHHRNSDECRYHSTGDRQYFHWRIHW